MGARPVTLVWLAVGFIAGVFLGSTIIFPAIPLLLLGSTMLAAALAGWRRPALRLPALLLLCVFAGGFRAELARPHIGPGDVAYYNGQSLTLTGYVNAEPDIRDTGNNYVITVQQLTHGGHQLKASGQVELHTAPGQLFNQGDQLQITGSLTTPANSVRVPYRSILANRGIYSEMSFPKALTVGRVSLGLVGTADAIRSGIESTLKRLLPEPEATFLIALLVGARSAQLGGLAPVLIQTGLIHLIAISGIKIAIVAGTVNDFLRLIAGRTARLGLSATIVLSYWLISGATVAGLRASLMWLLVFLAAYLGRPTYGLVSLGLAASVMLAVTPTLLWDTGFQLTVLATAAISTFTPFADWLLRWMPGALRASTSTTLAAQVGVLPVQIASFHVLSPISLLANGVVLPFVPLTMVAGFGAVVAQWPPITALAYGLTRVMIDIAQWAASLGTAMSLKALPISISLAYYLLLVGLAVAVWRFGSKERTPARGEWLFGLSVAAVGLGMAVAAPSPRQGISFLTNGSALITWHGQSVLVDGGSKPSTLLIALGGDLPYPNTRLDGVIVTTPSAKNIASLLAVAQTLPVGEALDPGIVYPSKTYARWRSLLSGHSIPTIALEAGVTLKLPGLSIRVLAPDGPYANPKDGAGILLIATRRQRILYLGDASLREQQDLPFRRSVRATMIVSPVAIDPVLAKAAGARYLISPAAGGFVPLDG